jgi:hypothetical protein
METILAIQPRVSSGVGGRSPDEVVMGMAKGLLEQVPGVLEETKGNQEHFVVD